MVVAVVLLLAASPVIRVASGPVTANGARATSGRVLAVGDTVETGPRSFVEVHLPRTARLRLSASTRMVLEADAVRLVSGRLWVQVGKRPYRIQTLRHRVDLDARTSAVLERTAIGGTVVAVRAGRATLRDQESSPQVIGAGHVARVGAGEAKLSPPRVGGRGTIDLVVMESRRALRDPLGVEAFLLRRSLAVTPRPRRARTVSEQVRSGAEIIGADSGAAGALVEDGFRPPPFFEDEIPPKGPNLRIEVEFSED